MPAEKRSRNRSHGYDIRDDLNYIDDESDLSSGELNMSDVELPVEQSRKRGRPKSQPYHPKEEYKRGSPAISSASPLNQQSYLNNNNYESDIDESGEQKVDKFGRLLGGREYRVPTFTLPTRGETQFMFSKDPAALLGFRDSFVFLKKNVKLVKVHIDTVEKGHLVDLNLLRSTFRTREISVVTARSVFKQFGHRVVKKGKRGRDDYYYTEEVDEEEDASEEEHNIKDSTEKTSSTPYIPTFEVGKNNLAHKPTSHDSSTNSNRNWLHNAAISTRQFNSSIFNYRRSNPTSYDLLTNVYQIPESKQAFVDTDVFLNPQENTLEATNNLALLNDDTHPHQFANEFLNFGQ